MSDASLQARPQSSEPSVKTIVPTMKMRRRPRRSAERPPSRRNPPKTSAYALITHCRFSCEKPRSTWIDGSATFTIAMSRMVMNCTARMSASANHFLRSEPTMRSPLSSRRLRCEERGMLARVYLRFASSTLSILKLTRLQSGRRGEELPPVLPDRTRPRPRGRALVAARRPRAARGRPASLLGPPLPGSTAAARTSSPLG